MLTGLKRKCLKPMYVYCLAKLSIKHLPYTWKFSRYEIFTEQEANRIFAIIFLQITGKVACVMYCYKF